MERDNIVQQPQKAIGSSSMTLSEVTPLMDRDKRNPIDEEHQRPRPHHDNKDNPSGDLHEQPLDHHGDKGVPFLVDQGDELVQRT